MNEKNNNNGDTPRLRSINNNMLWFILSKAFGMSINTNAEIFFSSIAFHRSSVTDRRAASVEWCLQLPLRNNCASLLLSSKKVTNCLWANRPTNQIASSQFLTDDIYLLNYFILSWDKDRKILPIFHKLLLNFLVETLGDKDHLYKFQEISQPLDWFCYM